MLMRRTQKARSLPASLAAPVGGWNARDALGNMPPLDAVYLTNWYPATTDVRLRNGYTNYSTGLGAQVETILVYAGGTTDKLFAITSAGNLYDCTSGGAVGAAAVSGLSNGRWQYTNIATPGGNFLVAFNGTDAGLRHPLILASGNRSGYPDVDSRGCARGSSAHASATFRPLMKSAGSVRSCCPSPRRSS